jgi:hypothetical protein
MTRWALGIVLILLTAGGGFFAWKKAQISPDPVAEKRFEDLSEAEHEAWLQELGYTD